MAITSVLCVRFIINIMYGLHSLIGDKIEEFFPSKNRACIMLNVLLSIETLSLI